MFKKDLSLLPIFKLIDFKEAVKMASSHNLLPVAVNPPVPWLYPQYSLWLRRQYS
jgi:hypothetical protein